MRRQFGRRNVAPDSRQMHVMQWQAGVRTTSALDYWDQLVCLHFGTRVGIVAHFRETTVEDTTFTWAGAPFADPTVGVVFSQSILTVETASRAFLYVPLRDTDTKDKLASVAPYTSLLGDYVGLRLDDGSDDNYLELVLRVSQASPTQWTVRTLRRTGGGAVSTQDGDAMSTDPGFVLRMIMVGTFWTAWNAYPALHTNSGFGGLMAKPFSTLGAVDLAFTPTRVGVVFYPGTASAIIAKVDWCNFAYVPAT